MTGFFSSIANKVPLIEKIFERQRNLSLRRKIMALILASLGCMGLTIVFVEQIDHYAITILGDSYKSNVKISDLSDCIARTKESMEQFIKYYTFESIESFHKNRSELEEKLSLMQNSPSVDETGNKEYVLKRLAETFIAYSGKVVSARRANSESEQAFYYGKAIKCYSFLNTELRKFDLFMHKVNSKIYEENRFRVSVLSNSIYAFIFVYFILISLYIYLLLTEILAPLHRISEVATRVSYREFDIPLFNSKANDEVGNICRAFDNMLISINDYVSTILEKARTETELKEKQIEMSVLYTKARLDALQAHINPHFLFNTLNTGVQLAMLEGAHKTSDFIEQVAAFFRYNIHEREASSIDEELLLVDHFVYIMKVRFGTRLNFVKSVPSLSFPQKLPAMILQPLCENCIKHGLENSSCTVTLKIQEVSDFVEISISDDGKGFDPNVRLRILDEVKKERSNSDSMEYLKGSDSPGNGIGITNVFSRLKIYFRMNDIFDIQTGDGGVGTRFIVRVPKDV